MAVKFRFTRSGARTAARVGVGGEALLRPARSSDAVLLASAGRPGPGRRRGRPCGPPWPACAARRPSSSSPRWPRASGPARRPGPSRADGGRDLADVVGGGGDLEDLADRLDPPSTPTGLSVPVGVDEASTTSSARRPSSSVAKKTDAAFKMSFARRSSRTSLLELGDPLGAAPPWSCPGRARSISAWFTQPRNDSTPTPSCGRPARSPLAPPCSRRSCTIRTARSFSSGGYRF